ncbi:MAG: hypothetical protein HY906_22715 [Deltaproteobacteria bacterium]|nr:hypothetical protein [Deltaproteobacteria bacterium]
MSSKLRMVMYALAGVCGGVVLVLSCDSGPGPANAQSDAGGGGACGTCVVEGPIAVQGTVAVQGPVTVQDPIRTKTPDADVDQLQRGVTVPSRFSAKQLLEGPFVLTDAHTQSAETFVFHVIPVGGNCVGFNSLGSGDAKVLALVHTATSTSGTAVANPIHGARLPVKSGEVLCVVSSDSNGAAAVYWAGFVPY